MNRKSLRIFAAGLVLGLAVGAGATGALRPGAAPGAPAPEKTPAAALPARESGGDATAPAQGEWDPAAVYVGGDRVVYQGKIYRAKWWTQGEAPGAADVWEDTLETPGGAAPQPAADPIPKTDPVPRPEGFKVVGYYPSWKPGEIAKPRYDVLTHLNYAFAIPTAEGGLRPLENPETARRLLRDAHASGVQVLLAVGGWSYNDTPLEPTFAAATETAAKRAALADAIVSMCLEYGFDGIDIDWEHPRVDGPSAAQYEAFMLLLADELHSRDKLLTSAVLSGATPDGNTYYDAAAHSDKVLAAVDWINVMAYDGGDGERHAPYGFAVACGEYWRDTRGLPGEKVVLGLPFYARPGWAVYGDVLAAAPDAWQGDHVNYNGMDAWYNGPDTIRGKTAHAAKELGGVMIWEITQDTADQDKSLQSAIASALSQAD